MEREMVKVVNYIKMEDEDHLDVVYWQSKTVAERLQEVVRLRKNYFTWLNGSFPESISKVITFRSNDF